MTRTKSGSLKKSAVSGAVKKVSEIRGRLEVTLPKLKVEIHAENVHVSKKKESYKCRESKSGKFVSLSGKSTKNRTTSGALKKSAVKSAVLSVSKSKSDSKNNK